jgi:hypothetical protein
MARSRANKIADGIKATQTKIAMFGPSARTRAVRYTAWRKENPGKPDAEKPHAWTATSNSDTTCEALWRKKAGFY